MPHLKLRGAVGGALLLAVVACSPGAAETAPPPTPTPQPTVTEAPTVAPQPTRTERRGRDRRDGRNRDRPGGKDCTATSTGLTPLTDLGSGRYKGQQGGLYPQGSNEVPEEHLRLGMSLAEQVQPLDASGQPDPGGQIGFLAVGVSNTDREFGAFMELVEAQQGINPALVLANAAQSRQDVHEWLDPGAGTWRTAAEEVAAAGLSAAQVQVAWVKLPDRQIGSGFPESAETYAQQLGEVMRILKAQYPNIKLAYHSSRIYGGYGRVAKARLADPFSYEQGFGVKWLIENQIQGASGLDANPAAGDPVVPWLAWGPYLWADGAGPDGQPGGEPGRSDGLEWLCEDFAESDGIHPAEPAQQKVAEMLLEFFSTAPTTQGWFLDPATG